MGIRVLLIDASALMRHCLRALLAGSGEFEVVGEAATASEAVGLVASTQPDVVLMEVSLRIVDGVATAREIVQRHPGVRVVMLCRHCEGQAAPPQHQCSTCTLLCKERIDGEQLKAALAAAAAAPGPEAPPCTAHCGAPEWLAVSGWSRLSRREREVLRMVVEGHTSAEIARVVRLSPKTVQTYRARIMNKLNVQDFAGLVKWAVKYGLTSLPG